MSRWRPHHELQERANWCVPACIAIARSRGAGRPVEQQRLVRKLFGGKSGYDLSYAVSDLGKGAFLQRPDPDDPNLVEWLELHLKSGAWIVCLVYCAELVGWMARTQIALQSPHGSLSSGVLHCIVLVESTPDGILYLDPFFTADGQPLCRPRTELARVLQSDLVVVPAPA